MAYSVGSLVTYNGHLYKCIQAHTSLPTWDPVSVPALWQDMGACTTGAAMSRTGGEIQLGREPTATSTPTGLPTRVYVLPNISTGGNPVKFHVVLEQSGPIELSLFSLLGERVYQSEVQGQVGDNVLNWNLENEVGNQVASGLYLYSVQYKLDGRTTNHIGKLVVLK